MQTELKVKEFSSPHKVKIVMLVRRSGVIMICQQSIEEVLNVMVFKASWRDLATVVFSEYVLDKAVV